jgi:hypothetical protein
MWQHMNWRWVWSPVNHRDAAQNIFLISFGIFDDNIKVPAFIEYILQCINQLIFWFLATPVLICFN